MCRLKGSDNAKSGQSLYRCRRSHFEMFDTVSSIGFGTIGVDRMFESIECVVNGSIPNGVNGDLEVKGIGKVDDGE
jgi:hypothetical protein